MPIASPFVALPVVEVAVVHSTKTCSYNLCKAFAGQEPILVCAGKQKKRHRLRLEHNFSEEVAALVDSGLFLETVRLGGFR